MLKFDKFSLKINAVVENITGLNLFPDKDEEKVTDKS